ncbi:hypothetical protein KFE98_15140 [bacterium SCSIO 12741]|nr:hypothetical protein KFE98_15140 [bacterium SCSIO 12741]
MQSHLIQSIRIGSLLVLMACALTSFGQSSDTLNVVDGKGRKQGKWEKKYENGKVRYTGQFKDDRPVGTFVYFDWNSVKMSEVRHTTNDSAQVVFYHKNGKKMAEGMYYQQKRTGKWKFYDAEEAISSQEFYLNGVKNGPARIYYKDGQIARDFNHRNGLEHGKLTDYFQNGKVKFRADYVDGNPDGKVEYFHPNGAIRILGYYRFAVQNGTWTYFDRNSLPERYEFYKEGFLKWRKSPEEMKEFQKEKKANKTAPSDSVKVKP